MASWDSTVACANPCKNTAQLLPQSLFQTSLLPSNNLSSFHLTVATHKVSLVQIKPSQLRQGHSPRKYSTPIAFLTRRIALPIVVSSREIDTSSPFIGLTILCEVRIPSNIKMQFSSVLLAAAAFALANAVQFTMSASFFSTAISAGSTVNITWSGASGPVTLLLKNGPATNLQTVSTIASK